MGKENTLTLTCTLTRTTTLTYTITYTNKRMIENERGKALATNLMSGN